MNPKPWGCGTNTGCSICQFFACAPCSLGRTCCSWGACSRKISDTCRRHRFWKGEMLKVVYDRVLEREKLCFIMNIFSPVPTSLPDCICLPSLVVRKEDILALLKRGIRISTWHIPLDSFSSHTPAPCPPGIVSVSRRRCWAELRLAIPGGRPASSPARPRAWALAPHGTCPQTLCTWNYIMNKFEKLIEL